MLVPNDLYIEKEISDLKSKIYITRYKENAPSKILTRLNENLLVVVLEGKKKISCDDYITTISKGEFGFFKKGNYIMNQILTNERYESLLIFISDEYINEIINFTIIDNISKNEDNMVSYIHGFAGNYMSREIQMIIELISDDLEKYDNIIKMKIKEIIMYIIKDDHSKNIVKFLYNCVKKVDTDLQKYMELNFDKTDNILYIANQLHMSLSTFKRRFQLCYGTTPGKWINLKRLKKSEILIKTTDYSITDICFLCGYESLSNFIFQFKKLYNISPGKYRKMIKLKDLD